MRKQQICKVKGVNQKTGQVTKHSHTENVISNTCLIFLTNHLDLTFISRVLPECIIETRLISIDYIYLLSNKYFLKLKSLHFNNRIQRKN